MADWHCPNCDFKNSDNSKTCISCGAERPGTEINIGAKEWECPKCGHKNSPDHTVCFSCGTPRSGSSEARTASGTKVSGKTAFICIAAALVIFVGVSAKNTGRKSTDTYSRTSVSTSAKPAYTTAETKKLYAYDYTPSYTQSVSSDSAALRTAKAYLAVMPFSHDGLIAQLEYEGYSHSEAKDAADNCGADWKAQAVLKAKDYLEYSSFSRDGLIDQLEYEKFTRSEAEYAADHCGIDTGSEACEQAKSYLRYSAFSKQGLIE